MIFWHYYTIKATIKLLVCARPWLKNVEKCDINVYKFEKVYVQEIFNRQKVFFNLFKDKHMITVQLINNY